MEKENAILKTIEKEYLAAGIGCGRTISSSAKLRKILGLRATRFIIVPIMRTGEFCFASVI